MATQTDAEGTAAGLVGPQRLDAEEINPEWREGQSRGVGSWKRLRQCREREGVCVYVCGIRYCVWYGSDRKLACPDPKITAFSLSPFFLILLFFQTTLVFVVSLLEDFVCLVPVAQLAIASFCFHSLPSLSNTLALSSPPHLSSGALFSSPRVRCVSKRIFTPSISVDDLISRPAWTTIIS